MYPPLRYALRVFAFLPIAAGYGRVRLPVVGLSIALVCLVAFLSTWVFADRSVDAQGLEEFKEYYLAHPYLKPPRVARHLRLPPADAAVAAPDDPQVLAQEQAELDRRFEKLVESSIGPMRRWSLVPARGLKQPGWLTSVFLHFGWMHLLGNLLFLYIVAPLLEDAWGRLRFLVFYLAGGLVANLSQFALAPEAQSTIAGASGAIAACMGAFSVRFATARVRVAYFLWLLRVFVGTAFVPAWLFGLAWFGMEVFSLARGGTSGVATGAHVGGFALGALVAVSMKAMGLEKALRTAEEAAFDERHHSDLFQSAEIGLARGDVDTARQNLTELLAVMPGRDDAELLLGELEMRVDGTSARFERAARRVLARNDVELLMTALVRGASHLDPARLTAPLALQLARFLEPRRTPRLDGLLEGLLRQGVKAGGRLGNEATAQLGRLFAGTQGGRPQAIELPSAEEPHAPAPATATSVRLRGLGSEGLTLESAGQTKTLAFEKIVAVHAAVAPVENRRVLFVDLVVRREPPLALRLTSDDPRVPALFPSVKPPQAWKMFVDQVVASAQVPLLPSATESGFPSLASEEDVRSSWTQWLAAN